MKLLRPESVKVCEWCRQRFARPLNYSNRQWEKARFCSLQCSGVRRIKDHRQKVLVLLKKDYDTECWIWQGPRNADGYGMTNFHKRRGMRAHTAVWELIHGRVSPGFELHHTCNNRLCCNPDHLQPVTDLEHNRIHALTHCPNGHLYDKDNTYVYPSGLRECRICRRARRRRHYEHKRAA
jgi:hypothetical protein